MMLEFRGRQWGLLHRRVPWVLRGPVVTDLGRRVVLLGLELRELFAIPNHAALRSPT